jgi:hypothetical protein
MAAKTLWCPSCAINVKSDSWSQIRREKRNNKVVYLHQKCDSLLSLRTETSKECPVCHTVGLGNYIHNRPEREETSGLLYGHWHRRFENEPCGPCISQISDNIKRIAEIDAEKANLAEYRLNRSPRLDFSFAADFLRRDEAAKAFYALLFAVTEGTRRRIHSSEGLETVPVEPPNASGDANRAEWIGRMTPEVKRVKGLTYISCSIEDSGPLHCLLDTGSSMTGISRDLAMRLKLKTHSDSSIPRADVAGKMLDEVTIHAGTASWTAQRVSIAPLDLALLDRESGDGFHADVILGTNLLEHFQVTVDPDAGQVGLAQPGTPAPAGTEKLFTSMQGVPFTILQVMTKEGHAVLGPFSIDTGSRPAIMLSRNFWASRPPLAVNDIHGAENELMVLDGFRLGSYTLQHVPALEPLHEGGLVAAKTVGGVIGAPILNRFLVVYDLPKNAVWIKPASNLRDSF